MGLSPSFAALPRPTVDRLDEQRGPQFHLVYAAPADGADRRLDENGAPVSGSTAGCRLAPTVTARGKHLTGSVQAVVGSLSAKRTFTRVVR